MTITIIIQPDDERLVDDVINSLPGFSVRGIMVNGRAALRFEVKK